MAAMLRNSVVVVRTRPRAIPLTMITMRKSTHGFPSLSYTCLSMGLRLAALWAAGAPLLYTNTRLYKIGFATDENCSFFKSHPKTLSHLLFDCIYSQTFRNEFELYFYFIPKQLVSLTLKDVIIYNISSL